MEYIEAVLCCGAESVAKRTAQTRVIYWTGAEHMPPDLFSFMREAERCFFSVGCFLQHTAELTAEAVIDAGIPALVIRDVARRVPLSDIPPHGDFSDSWFRSHRGPFYLGAGGPPSGHTLAAFSIATIFAERYPKHRWVPWIAYAGAGGVAFSRITKQAHFPSDVFAGAVLG